MFTAADAIETRNKTFDAVVEAYVMQSTHLTQATIIEHDLDHGDNISDDPYADRVAYIVAMLEARGFKVTYTAYPAEEDEMGAFTEITFSWADAGAKS